MDKIEKKLNKIDWQNWKVGQIEKEKKNLKKSKKIYNIEKLSKMAKIDEFDKWRRKKICRSDMLWCSRFKKKKNKVLSPILMYCHFSRIYVATLVRVKYRDDPYNSEFFWTPCRELRGCSIKRRKNGLLRQCKIIPKIASSENQIIPKSSFFVQKTNFK